MNWHDTIKDTRAGLRALNKAIPETSSAFAALGSTVKEHGAVSFKTKEFVALGIAVATKCEPCIALHIEALVRVGASREEIADVLKMTIQMGGGPALMYAAKAFACFDALAD